MFCGLGWGLLERERVGPCRTGKFGSTLETPGSSIEDRLEMRD